MSIALTNPISRGSDNGARIAFVEINFVGQAISVTVQFSPTGNVKKYMFAGDDLAALRQAVSQFAGLRLALEQYLAANKPELAGEAT